MEGFSLTTIIIDAIVGCLTDWTKSFLGKIIFGGNAKVAPSKKKHTTSILDIVVYIFFIYIFILVLQNVCNRNRVPPPARDGGIPRGQNGGGGNRQRVPPPQGGGLPRGQNGGGGGNRQRVPPPQGGGFPRGQNGGGGGNRQRRNG
ncbi:hypothetical protein ACB092_01G278300 [Castanea dentata]